MIPVETVPGVRGGGMKETGGGGEFKYDVFVKNVYECKCHNVPPPSTIKEKILIP
jgi:hypothetical protein